MVVFWNGHTELASNSIETPKKLDRYFVRLTKKVTLISHLLPDTYTKSSLEHRLWGWVGTTVHALTTMECISNYYEQKYYVVLLLLYTFGLGEPINQGTYPLIEAHACA